MSNFCEKLSFKKRNIKYVENINWNPSQRETAYWAIFWGAIEPAVALSQKKENESFLFIADLHSLTSVKDPVALNENTRAVASAWLACGFDAEKNFFYRQSKLAGLHTELMWYLSCVTPYPMLANAHSFKEKSDKIGRCKCWIIYISCPSSC